MNKISQKVREIAKEIKAITWPSRSRVINDTMIVVVALVFGGIVIALVDKGLLTGSQQLIEKVQQ